MVPTTDEKNEVLNRFMPVRCELGWARCPHAVDVQDGNGVQHDNYHPFNYYADTPEAREATRLLKDEFVRRMGREVTVTSYPRRIYNHVEYYVEIVDFDAKVFIRAMEHHAILDAIYEAIKKEYEVIR